VVRHVVVYSPAVPRRATPTSFEPERKRTDRIATFELATTVRGICAATHSRASGTSQLTVGRLTTLMSPAAKAVFGMRSSPTESTFFDSWKSPAEAASRVVPRRRAGASRGSAKMAMPDAGSYAAAATRTSR
jgi:hypothetical protein